MDDFPILDRLTYLNSASVGLVPAPIIKKAHDFEADLAERGTTGFDEDTETAVLEDARTGAARLFNTSADSIAIAGSFTEALCQLAWFLRPGAGRNIVSTDIDFPSVTYPWFRIAEDTGAEVRLVPVLEDPLSLTVDRVAEFVDSRTDVISISHVQYLTGHRLDPSALADLAHAHDALLILDATQSAGQVPIDVEASDVDVCITGSYKFLCSTFGAAACYIAPRLLDGFRPPLVGWRSTIDPYQLDARYQALAPSARRMEYSTSSYASAVAFGAALNYVLAFGPQKIFDHNVALGGRLIQGLQERGATLLTPEDPDLRIGLVTARWPGRDGEEVARELSARNVIVSPRVGSTRFSIHFYNTEADIDRAFEVLDEVLSG